MRIAAVDIGTNTVLLLIADIDKNGIITPILDQLETPRLGEGSHRTGVISSEAVKRTLEVIRKHKEFASRYHAETIFFYGTSALREAKNRNDVVTIIKDSIGGDISVIDGDEEALLAFNGALSGFPFLHDRALVIDIGGGSTEIATCPDNVIETMSYPLGAVRLTERFLKDDPPKFQQLDEAIQFIRNSFHYNQLRKPPGSLLIGVAGTPTTLACLDLELAEFDSKLIEGYRLKFDRVTYWAELLSSRSSAQISSMSHAVAGREDIITVAVHILKEFMEFYQFSEVCVSTRGLRYGIILKEWDRLFKNKTAI
jgi:exopolyphosphatase/guanosine-5'-triphosphate,3'-diphosphate pyrophosphatase